MSKCKYALTFCIGCRSFILNCQQFILRKKEIFPGQEHSVQLTATLIDSDEGNITFFNLFAKKILKVYFKLQDVRRFSK